MLPDVMKCNNSSSRPIAQLELDKHASADEPPKSFPDAWDNGEIVQIVARAKH